MERVVMTWSGGIDSTAVLGHLLRRNYSVLAVSLNFYKPDFCNRESLARSNIRPFLQELIKKGNGSLEEVTKPGNFLWSFSNDNKEVPRRNKLILDHLLIIPHLAMRISY